jgi:hypothetical protein
MRFRFFVPAFFMASVACGKGTNSNVNVVGGVATKEYPSVLRFLTDLESSRFCTGVVVSETTALIAGHCIKNMTVYDQIYAEGTDTLGKGAPIKSDKIYFWPALGNLELLDEREIARDLAVVVFNSAPFKSKTEADDEAYIKLAPEVHKGTRKAKGSYVSLVGYGANELGKTKGARDSLGTKRIGSNQISDLAAGYYTVRSKISEASLPDHAFAADGDAGAPLLDEKGQLIGIGAGFMLTDANGIATAPEKDENGFYLHSLKDAVYAVNSFVDLSSAESRRLLAYAAWQGRPGKGHVKIPGIQSDVEALLQDDDRYWMELNPKLPDSDKDPANDLERVSTWVAMTGGGAFSTTEQGLALQGLLPGQCAPSYTGPRTMSAADCARYGGPTRMGPVSQPPFNPMNAQARSIADQWRNASPAQRGSLVGGQAGFSPGMGSSRPGPMPPQIGSVFGGIGASQRTPPPFGPGQGAGRRLQMQSNFMGSGGFGGPFPF